MNRTPTQTACTDAHSVSQYVLNRLTPFHHANARGSRAGRLRVAHLCVLKQLSSTCHVSYFAAPDSDHKFSITYLTYLSGNLTNTQDLRYTIHIYPANEVVEWRINTNPISHNCRCSGSAQMVQEQLQPVVLLSGATGKIPKALNAKALTIRLIGGCGDLFCAFLDLLCECVWLGSLSRLCMRC